MVLAIFLTREGEITFATICPSLRVEGIARQAIIGLKLPVGVGELRVQGVVLCWRSPARHRLRLFKGGKEPIGLTRDCELLSPVVLPVECVTGIQGVGHSSFIEDLSLLTPRGEAYNGSTATRDGQAIVMSAVLTVGLAMGDICG
jgi:hypothetical protein